MITYEFYADRKHLYKPTVLIDLEPIGIGTAFVEGMCSYLTRLAERQLVSTRDLLINTILPEIGKAYLEQKNAERFFSLLNRLLCVCPLASEFSAVLDRLTGRNNLGCLSMQNWKCLSNYKLIKKKQEWCPKCLEEWKQQGLPIYFPLMWSISPVAICSKHEVKLEDRCPDCEKTVPYLSRYHENGFCPHCRNWLGSSRGTRIQKKAEQYAQQVWFIEQIGLLLSSNEGNDTCSFPKLSENLLLLSKLCRKYDCHGRWTSVIDGWLLEDITPSIDSLLEISYRLSVPLEILLMNEINESDLDVSKLLWHPKRRRQSCQLNVEKVIKICLEYYLGISPDVPSPSLKFVAEEIGCDLSTIRSHYPELASQISHNYVACQKEQTRVRHEEIEKTVRTAVESIVTSGGIPTLNEVKSIIPHVNVNPNGIGYQAWRKAINTQSDRCCPVY